MNQMKREMRWPMDSSRYVAVTLIVAGCVGSGCNSSAPAPSPDTGPGSSTTESVDTHCATLLDSIMDMLQPDRLNISSDATTVAGTLNEWARTCHPLDDSKAASDAVAEALLKSLLTDEEREIVGSDRFLSRDGQHIRDCIWSKRTVAFAAGSAGSELERTVNLFNYVVRNVDLVAPGSVDIPLPSFWVALFGKGTVEDRVWIFANLLRQMRIDSVILRPKASASDAETSKKQANWLMGVLLADGVYLFDPRLGLPVPADSAEPETLLVEKPATLSQILENGSLLEQIYPDADGTEPLRPEGLREPRVELIGSSAFWSFRMRVLQMSLTGERSVVVYDGLQGDTVSEGLVARVARQGKGKWQKEAISVWPYPETRLQAYARLDEKQAGELKSRREGFEAPVPGEFTPDASGTPRIQFGRPSGQQLKYRTSQLLGMHQDVISRYITIQLGAEFPPQILVPPEIRRIHRLAGQDARFWVGVCQFERGEHRSAGETLLRYVKLYPSGKWVASARYLLALSLVHTDRLADAILVLEQSPDTEPQHAGHALLARRLRAFGQAAGKPASAKASR